MKYLPLILYITLVSSRNGLNSTSEGDRVRQPLVKRASEDVKQDIVMGSNTPTDPKDYPISAIVALIDSLDQSAGSSEIPPTLPENLRPPNLATPVTNPIPIPAIPRQVNIPDNSSPTTTSDVASPTSPSTPSTSNVVYVTVTAQPPSSTATSELSSSSSSSEEPANSDTPTESSDSNTEVETSALDISSIFELDSNTSVKSSSSIMIPKVLVTIITIAIACL